MTSAENNNANLVSAPHAITVEVVLQSLGTDHVRGLNSTQVSERLSVVTLPFAKPVFEVATYLAWEWVLVFGLALVPVTIVELIKIVRAFLRGSAQAAQ